MSPHHAIAALLCAGLLLTGCAEVGPDYATPPTAKVNLPAAQGGFLGVASPGLSTAPVEGRWWRLYDDPILDGLIEQALAANTDLRVAAANLARARAVSAEVAAAGEVAVSTSAGAQRAQVSAESYLMTQPVPVMTLGDAGVNVAYEIDLVGRLKRAAEAARADTEVSAAGLDLARVAVAADVVRAYADACSAGRQAATAQTLADLQDKSLDVARRLGAAGRGSALEVTRGRALADQAHAGIPGFDAQRRAALYRLAVLTGRPPAEFPRALETCAVTPRLARPIPVGDGAQLLRRRPDVRQAERALAGATARIGVATAALYPTVSLGLGAGSTGILGDLGQPLANHWNFGSLISWSLPTGGTRARIREAGAGADAALARFDGTVLAALRETETSLTVYTHDLARNADVRAARDEAAAGRDQALALRRAGRSPYLAGLDAERSLAAAEAALAGSDAQVADDQVALFLALGGGWEGEK